MQDSTESNRLIHLSDDGQEFIIENDKMYKIKEHVILPDGAHDYIVNELVNVPDIEDRPPYDTELIVDRQLYIKECIMPNVIWKQWYQKMINYVDEFLSKDENILDKEFISNKIIDQYLDTEYYIIAHKNDEDWYFSITDFIWYNIESFGMVKGQASGFGSGVYIGFIIHFVKGSTLSLDIKDKLLNYLTPFNDESLKSEKSCKDLIVDTYKTWLNLFPFELSHFTDIKNKYLYNLPLLYKIPPRVNRFTNELTATLYTQNDIISFLLKKTDELHREFNGTILFERGLLTDANRNLIEIANKTRLLKLEELNEKTPFESTVLEKINHWLKCEKDYINEINELIKLAPPATEQPTNIKESETNLTSDQEIIYNHIKHLKGNNLNREKIMSDENFIQLFNDLCYLVENDAVPEFKKPLSQIMVTNQSIIYTLRLIHVELFGSRKIRQSFILFLETYFQQLSDRENMKIAFSKEPPKKYPF